MRRMLTSRQIEILDSMTEEVFESGVWEIEIGATDEALELKNLDVGYQYKIYLNASANPSTVLRFETEIGLSQDYCDFIGHEKNIVFSLGAVGGITNMKMLVYINNDGVVMNELGFEDTATHDVYFRYLITRHKLYI